MPTLARHYDLTQNPKLTGQNWVGRPKTIRRYLCTYRLRTRYRVPSRYTSNDNNHTSHVTCSVSMNPNRSSLTRTLEGYSTSSQGFPVVSGKSQFIMT